MCKMPSRLADFLLMRLLPEEFSFEFGREIGAINIIIAPKSDNCIEFVN